MGIAELRAAVEARAREQMAALQREASERAEQLLAEARAERARRREARLADERRALRRQQVVRLGAARRSARERVLGSRAAFLERVFAAAGRAAERDAALRPAPAEVASRVESALARLPAGPVTFTCSPDLARAVEAALEGRDAALEIDPQGSPGFVARGAEGRLEVDARWDALLEQRRQALAIEVVRRFSEGPTR